MTPLLTPEQRQSLVALFTNLLQDHSAAWAAIEATMAELIRASQPEPAADAARRLAQVHEAAEHIAAAMHAEGVRMRLAYDAMTACLPASVRPVSPDAAIH